MLTAISVARDCGMVRAHERVIVADAVPPKDLHPASITWHYTENTAQTIKDTQVRQKASEPEERISTSAVLNSLKLQGFIHNVDI